MGFRVIKEEEEGGYASVEGHEGGPHKGGKHEGGHEEGHDGHEGERGSHIHDTDTAAEGRDGGHSRGHSNGHGRSHERNSHGGKEDDGGRDDGHGQGRSLGLGHETTHYDDEISYNYRHNQHS